MTTLHNIPQNLQTYNNGKRPLRAKGKYCIITGDRIIYHLTYQQLETIYHQIKSFREAPTKLNNQLIEDKEDYKIKISQFTELQKDSQPPKTFYSIYSQDCDIQMLSYSRIKKLSDMLQTFLKTYGEQTAKNSLSSLENQLENKSTAINILLSVKKDLLSTSRPYVFETIPQINRRILWESDMSGIKIEYMLAANELNSVWLNLTQLYSLHQRIKNFLKKSLKDQL